MSTDINIASEFQALPLDSILSTPLIGVIKAQAVAAATTHDFITSMIKDGKPITIDFDVTSSKTDVATGKQSDQKLLVKAPLLSIVPVPHLRIDSLTVQFKYEISQAVTVGAETTKLLGGSAGTTGTLASFVNVSLKGSVSSKAKEDSVMNRSGMLEITMHASEAPIPEGLAKILNLLTNSIQVTPVQETPVQETPVQETAVQETPAQENTGTRDTGTGDSGTRGITTGDTTTGDTTTRAATDNIATGNQIA